MIKLFKKLIIYIMPGRHFRQINTKPLSRKQSMIAKNTLESFYQYEKGCRQWEFKKEILVDKVNKKLKDEKLDTIYTTRKLEDYLSNKLYRDKKKRKTIGFSKLKLLPELNYYIDLVHFDFNNSIDLTRLELLP